jgi:ParB family chromosome partitioning protein
MAKRGGLGRGLDALIPDRKSDKHQKTIEESVELKEIENQEEQISFSEEVNTDEADSSDQAAKGDSNLNNLESESRVSEESITQDQPIEELNQNSGMVQESKSNGHEQVINMRISLIEPNRSQPRKYFDDSAISELADSVRQFGIIQPLLVQKKDDYYEIIAGERRWRAANKAGLKEIPVIVKNFSNQEAVEVSLIENIQREDLNPIEEAKAYERLVKEYGLSQEAVAGRVSKSRTSITNSMRLLKLDQNVQQMVETGELSEGHARAILGLPDQNAQKELADKVINERLSVRQTEKLVRETARPRKAAKEKSQIPSMKQS